mmetsp:Transcript_77126/g.186362  ORF Transcript_77126/g.186362 Transcript_77126/m.186362 type:complete len:220 (+) Transcript_77126:61-720(+)
MAVGICSWPSTSAAVHAATPVMATMASPRRRSCMSSVALPPPAARGRRSETYLAWTVHMAASRSDGKTHCSAGGSWRKAACFWSTWTGSAGSSGNRSSSCSAWVSAASPRSSRRCCCHASTVSSSSPICSSTCSGPPSMAQPSASLTCHCCRKRCASARSGAAASATRIVPAEACAATRGAAMPSSSSSARRVNASRLARMSSSPRATRPPDGGAVPTW